jgi:hypothetical protein
MTELQPQTGFLDAQGAPLYYEVAGRMVLDFLAHIPN